MFLSRDFKMKTNSDFDDLMLRSKKNLTNASNSVQSCVVYLISGIYFLEFRGNLRLFLRSEILKKHFQEIFAKKHALKYSISFHSFDLTIVRSLCRGNSIKFQRLSLLKNGRAFVNILISYRNVCAETLQCS